MLRNKFFRPVLQGLIIPAAVVMAVSAVAWAPPDWSQRIERLTERLEEARQNDHIPGMAIVVVKDDQIVYAKGFGLANIEEEIPVTKETIFAIGSSTKAFTASLVGMLVDEGKMNWDDSVTKYLPYFTLQIDTGSPDDTDRSLILRDMLSHQTGFTRMSMLFISGAVPREEILRTANNAQPWKKAHEEFLYNNVMYMASGMSAGVADGSDWETLMTQRLLEPLQMENSSLSITIAQNDPRLSLGYMWDDIDETWEHLPMRNIDTIGPAGAINSNVLDMANWLRFQLGHGEFNGVRLLSEESHAETWKMQMPITNEIGYGFGWMLQQWKDQQVVEHGGNIDGFGAQVALLPESNLGFVLLTNTTFSALQQGSIQIVFNALEGDWEMQDNDTSDLVTTDSTVKDMAGVYIANYAKFEDEEFTVSVREDGRLDLNIPSQRTYTLDTPNESSRMPFADAPGIAASFERDNNGDVIIMRLYQNGMQFDVPRLGYEYPVEIPREDLEKYLGKYRFEQAKTEVTLVVKNNHLAVDIPNQMVFELHAPDEEDMWQFRSNDDRKLSISFQESEFGEVESLTLNQMGREFVMPRIQAEDSAELPSNEDFFELMKLDSRQAALEKAGIVQITGSVLFEQSGIEGSGALIFDTSMQFHNNIDMGKFGRITTCVTEKTGWIDKSFDKLFELEGHWLETAQSDHPRSYLGDWRSFYDEIRVTRLADIDGEPVIVVQVKKGDSPASKLHVSQSTGDILRVDTSIEAPGLPGVRFPVTTNFTDWRETAGLRIPHRIAVLTPQNGRMIMTVEEVKTHAIVANDLWIMPVTDNDDGT